MTYTGFPQGDSTSQGHLTVGFVGNDVLVDFTLPEDPGSSDALDIWIDSVFQSSDKYTTDGTTLTFFTAPGAGAVISVKYRARKGYADTISAGAVDNSKIRHRSISLAKMAHGNANKVIKFSGGVGAEADVDALVDPTVKSNIVQNSFNIAVNASEAIHNMVDGFSDAYIDDTGVNAAQSAGEFWAGNLIADHNIAVAGRWNSATSAMSGYTPTGASTTTCTVSYWMLRSKITDLQATLNTASGGTYTTNTLNANDTFKVQRDTGGFDIDTSAVLRDASDWIHVVVAYDSSNATQTERLKVWFDGVLQPVVGAYPGASTDIRMAYPHYWGLSPTLTYEYEGYLADIYWIDNQVLSPTDFAKEDATTGKWIAIDYTGTFGSLDYHITDPSTGLDVSGNANHFTTVTNIDQVTSTPTNNFITYNFLEERSSTLTEGNLRSATITSSSAHGVGTIYVKSGLWYWEQEETTHTGTGNIHGICTAGGDFLSTPSERNFYGFYAANGNKYSSVIGGTPAATAFSTALAASDKVMFAFNADIGALWIGKNGTWLNGATKSEIEAADTTNAMFSGIDMTKAWTVLHGDLGGGDSARLINGSLGFNYTAAIPANYLPINTDNIVDTDFFDHKEGFASGTFSYATGGISFTPDVVKWSLDTTDWMIRIKRTDLAGDWYYFDTVRGLTEYFTQGTGNSTTDANTITGRTSSQISLGTSAIFVNGGTYYYEIHRVGAKYGFDVVPYTGTGAVNNVSHSLGTKPHYWIIGVRAGTSFYPSVYHHSVGATQYGTLGTTNAFAAALANWNNTEPTASVFTLGTEPTVNGNTFTFVAYLWASISGFSAFGSYKANASANGPMINAMMSPASSTYKITSGVAYWVHFNRLYSNNYNPMTLPMYLNDTSVPTAARGASIDTLTNGAKPRSTSDDINVSTHSYIYMMHGGTPFVDATTVIPGKYYSPATANMVLISTTETAVSEPTSARISINYEAIDSSTLNTDIKAYATKENLRTVTTDFATDDKIDLATHGLVANDRVTFESTTTLPAGLSSGVLYYVVNPTTNDFEVSLTSGGAAVDITDNGTGTHSVTKWDQGTLVLEGPSFTSGESALSASVDLSGQATGTSMRYLIEILNSKDQRIHASALQWN